MRETTRGRGDVGGSGRLQGGPVLTCLMAVTVMTKNKGRPLVTGLVGVSTITWWEGEAHDTSSQTQVPLEPTLQRVDVKNTFP